MNTLRAIWWILTNLTPIFRVMWKAETGRLYYFRDEAQEFVEAIAEFPLGSGGPDVDRMIIEARNEFARRARRAA